jgi:hypothetical protein
MGTKYKKPNQLSLSESIALYGDKERAITYEMDAKERAVIRRHNRLLANRPKYNVGCYSKKIYEMGTQSLYNPSQTNPASQALAGYNTGSVTGSTPGLDARSAIPGLGIGLDNIVGGGINAIGSYMHGENQRQKMMAQNRNQQDMMASQNSQMRRFGAVGGQQTDTVLRNEDLNSLNSSYQRVYEEGTEAVDTNAPTPDSAMIEVEKDELVFRRFGASYQLVADFIGGNTHEEGGEPFVAKEGDVIFPGSMRNIILPMVDDSGFVKYKFMDEFEKLRQQLPEDTPQGTAKNQAVSDKIIGTGMQMAETPKFEMGGTVNPAQAETLQPMQTNVGPPTQLKQNLNVQRNEQNILNQFSGQGVSANQVAPATRMPIAGEEFAGMAGQGPINSNYKAEHPLMGNQEYINRAREQAMLNEQKATLFPQQQEAMQKAIDKRENKGRVSNRFGNNDSLIQTNGVSTGDFMFALGQDMDYQTQQNMRNYQSQYPMGTKYYKPKRYDEGTASAKPTPWGSVAKDAPSLKEFRERMSKYPSIISAFEPRGDKRRLDELYQEIYGTEKHGGWEGYKKAWEEEYVTNKGEEAKKYSIMGYEDPYTLFNVWSTNYGQPTNPFYKLNPTSGIGENLGWQIHPKKVYNVSAGSPINVTYTDKIVTRDVPKEVVNTQTQLEIQKEMVPTSINDNRTFNDSRSRWQNNNQGNAISGHFNSGGYSIVDGNIIFNPGGGINIGNQNVTQNQNDYNQGMYGGAGGSGVEAVKSSNDAEVARVQQKQQAINTENANNANKIIKAQQEANSKYQLNKTAAINEAMSGNEAARKSVMEQQAANRQAEIAKAVQAGADPNILQKKMDENQQPVPETPKKIKEFKKGTKYISKDRTKSDTQGSVNTEDSDVDLNQKFKGDIGNESMAGVGMGIMGQGNNINQNRSITGDQIHNIRSGHNINIGNLGGMDGLDPNIDMKSLGKGPKIKRYKDSATTLGPMGMQNMNTTNVNLEQKNYADLSDPIRLAAQNATMQATQAGAMAGGGAGLAGVIAAQNQGLDTRFGIEAAEASRLNQTQQANVDIRNQSALTNAQNKIAVDQFNTSNAQSLTSANKAIEAQNAIFRQSAINAANNRALQQAALDQRNRELAAQIGLAGLTAKTQMGMANRQLASDVVNNALTSTGGGIKTPTGPPAPPTITPTPDYMKPGFIPTPINPDYKSNQGVMNTPPPNVRPSVSFTIQPPALMRQGVDRNSYEQKIYDGTVNGPPQYPQEIFGKPMLKSSDEYTIPSIPLYEKGSKYKKMRKFAR